MILLTLNAPIYCGITSLTILSIIPCLVCKISLVLDKTPVLSILLIHFIQWYKNFEQDIIKFLNQESRPTLQLSSLYHHLNDITSPLLPSLLPLPPPPRPATTTIIVITIKANTMSNLHNHCYYEYDVATTTFCTANTNTISIHNNITNITIKFVNLM